MSYYNHITDIERSSLPATIQGPVGLILNPTTDQLQAAGWITEPITPFSPPEGQVIVKSSRRIEWSGNSAQEVYDIYFPFVVPDGYVTISGTRSFVTDEDGVHEQYETQTEADALEAVKDQLADFEAWDTTQKIALKLIVKQINMLRGEHGLPQFTAEQIKAALKAEQ